jgi:hypothetical protein
MALALSGAIAGGILVVENHHQRFAIAPDNFILPAAKVNCSIFADRTP